MPKPPRAAELQQQAQGRPPYTTAQGPILRRAIHLTAEIQVPGATQRVTSSKHVRRIMIRYTLGHGPPPRVVKRNQPNQQVLPDHHNLLSITRANNVKRDHRLHKAGWGEIAGYQTHTLIAEQNNKRSAPISRASPSSSKLRTYWISRFTN